MLIGVNRDGRRLHQSWITKRDADGVCVELEPMGETDEQLTSDIFDNLPGRQAGGQIDGPAQHVQRA